MTISRRAALTRLAVFAAGASWLTREARAQTYRYDPLGRVRCVTFGDGSQVQYSYDDAGNRTQVARAPPGATFTQTIAITGSGPVNLRTLAEAAGYDGIRNANITFTIASGVTITGAAGQGDGGVAIDTGLWPAPFCNTAQTFALTLQISGKVFGGGGRGGRGARPGAATLSGVGGDAIYCRVPLSITVNSGGEVRGGGGGGGGGGGFYQSEFEFDVGGGGGGGGFPNGPGGAAGGSSGGTAPQAGVVGTTSGGGAGGAGNGSYVSHTGGAGGAGGGAAATGSNGVNGAGSTGSGWSSFIRSTGGAAGYAIRKNGQTVPVTNNGTISGTVG